MKTTLPKFIAMLETAGVNVRSLYFKKVGAKILVQYHPRSESPLTKKLDMETMQAVMGIACGKAYLVGTDMRPLSCTFVITEAVTE
jgi:hypothetical protein